MNPKKYDVKITAVREGQVWVSRKGEKPESLCDSAWDSMRWFVEELSAGRGNFFDGWMKNPYSAMISCNDGFRPVSFLLERLDPQAPEAPAAAGS